ncbi:ATP-binding protein [Lacihabitans soyangensis]|uniref:histidine kinase n=1 Tax=Lacihabitans soyangensis TaxID=869394 RepID=A0AAE3KU00_9BACT|nr:ATP-binding protein [Lacihabitans soyangensis]MCP9762696.1 response regulator [Lacihabitans soyangensis]
MFFCKKRKITIGYFLLYFTISKFCLAQDFVISKSTKLPYDLSLKVSWFEDATAKLSFQEVKKQTFIKHEKKSVLLPFSNQATWLKIDLKNESYQDTTFYLFLDNQLVRRTTLYINNQADSLVFEPFKDKGFSNLKYPHFPIILKPKESKSYYLKFESERGAYFKLQLYGYKDIEDLNGSYKIRLGVIVGLTWMILFIVCIIGFMVIKDRKSRSYAIYTLARAFSFWASLNILGNFIGTDPTVSEKVTFGLMNIYPIMGSFLALNILPFGNLPRWVKHTIYGFIVINLFLLLLLFIAYGPVFLKLLVILNLISHSFFYTLFIYTLIKKINQSPFYAIPFLLGNVSNVLLNLRVSGILQFENIYGIAIFVALTEIAVYVYYLSQNFRASVKIQAEKLRNLGFEAEKAAKLEELDKLKTRFFTNISHEFRTPLTLLVGPIEDLKKKFPQEGIIDVMQRNLQRLQTLINQLLDLSKLEAGEMKPNLQEVDLNNFLNQLVASFESLAHSKHIIFKHSQPHTPHFALFDTDKLEKIVTNLLSNAFKFTPENGRIVIKIDYSDNQLIVQIQDSGIGIEEARLPHIFDRFYQVEEHNNYEGTGIGLALVKELVDLLQGTIEVSSQKGVGTRFELVLPFTPLEKLSNPVVQFERKVNVDESLISANPKIDSPIEADGQSIMLIVEDNPDLRNYIASVFENQYQIIMAVDGEDGLSKALEFIPDIVISDLMMPKLDGLGLCEKLKTDERTSHIPVVMLTAKASLSDRLAGLEHGADDYLSKPFNKEELQIRVKNLVSQRQLLFDKFSAKTLIEKIEVTKEPTIEEIFVKKCQSVIDKYLDKSEFDVEKFADEMRLSPVQLRRKLKAITDQNITEFVRNYRLEIAAKLLKTSDFSVSEIAYKVGFDSMPYFSKVFQERYGKTASEWKE